MCHWSFGLHETFDTFEIQSQWHPLKTKHKAGHTSRRQHGRQTAKRNFMYDILKADNYEVFIIFGWIWLNGHNEWSSCHMKIQLSVCDNEKTCYKSGLAALPSVVTGASGLRVTGSRTTGGTGQRQHSKPWDLKCIFKLEHLHITYD